MATFNVYEIYKDKKGEIRWVAKSRNGKKIASSGEGFKRMRGCINSISALTGRGIVLKDLTKKK